VSLSLSYVVVTDTFATITDVLRAVAGQTIRESIELVIVCPSMRELALDRSATAGIGAVRIVEAGAVIPLSPARAAGIRECTRDYVFIGETHSFPAPDCMEAILAAHRSGDYAAIAPVIENANPVKALSWAELVLTYRHWLQPAERAEVEVVSTYNASFRRQALLDLGDRLTQMLDYGSGLDVELRRRGGRFLIEPAARLGHLNIGAYSAWLQERFLSGRFWGAARSRHWPAGRRLFYTLGAPLIPLMIAGKALRSPQWAHHRGRMPRGAARLTMLSAVPTAAGEATAYVAGMGHTPVSLAEYELHRARYL
jgi:hypothetical protein